MVDRTRMEKLTRGLKSKSDKIRALSAAGCGRAEIARFLGIRYQHVRNVLVENEKKMKAASDKSAVVREGIRGRVHLKIDGAGRIVIPVALREAMDVGENGTVMAWLEKGELRLVSQKVALRQAQDLARELGVGRGLADELIAERREEARRESADG
jgi:bifunctional DNA-binding transcriptional regulator/antitoxin component of YhaV-PrlF toxin-antitoxin module